ASNARLNDYATAQNTTLSGQLTLNSGTTLTVNTFGGDPQTTGADLTISGKITGGGGLVKNNIDGSSSFPNVNVGSLFLTNSTNDFTGPTTINTGQLAATVNGALGAGRNASTLGCGGEGVQLLGLA